MTPSNLRSAKAGEPTPANASNPGPADAAAANLILFTPGPVRTPPIVTQYLANPPCTYHRQDAFTAMFADTEARLKTLIGIREPESYFATLITSTGTGGNEATLLALAGTGKGLLLRNGYFGNRAAQQAAQLGIDHVVLDSPHDRPIDPDDVARAIDSERDLHWVFFVSHETRMGLVNPFEAIGRTCKERGLLVASDIVSSSYAYPLDLEAAQIDIAISSSAKAIQAIAGLAIVFVKLDALPVLQRGRQSRGYYLDLVAELEKQRSEHQTRFAQPVGLHAALHAACLHMSEVGIANHMARIRRQLHDIAAHLEAMDVHAMLEPDYRSWIAVNFRLPGILSYAQFSRRMIDEGYFVLYGIPGDSSHFQISTIGHLTDANVAGLGKALSRVLS